MTAPLSAIVGARRTEITKSELQTDAETAVQEVANVYYAVGYCADSISAKCRKHGMDALLATIDPDIAASFSTGIAIGTVAGTTHLTGLEVGAPQLSRPGPSVKSAWK